MVHYGFASQHPTTLFVYVHLLNLPGWGACRKAQADVSQPRPSPFLSDIDEAG